MENDGVSYSVLRVDVSDADDKARVKELPDRFLRTAELYLVEHLSASEIADEQGIAVRTVYHRLDLVARVAGRPIPRRHRAGRPRKLAAAA